MRSRALIHFQPKFLIVRGTNFVNALLLDNNQTARVGKTRVDIVGPRCQQGFPSGPSALLMHLESGGRCAKRLKLTRAKITQFVMDAENCCVGRALSRIRIAFRTGCMQMLRVLGMLLHVGFVRNSS